MMLARVVANVVSTEKHPHYTGHKILVVQPVDPAASPRARAFWRWTGCRPASGTWCSWWTRAARRGRSSAMSRRVTIRTAICGIVDRVDIEDQG